MKYCTSNCPVPLLSLANGSSNHTLASEVSHPHTKAFSPGFSLLSELTLVPYTAHHCLCRAHRTGPGNTQTPATHPRTGHIHSGFWEATGDSARSRRRAGWEQLRFSTGDRLCVTFMLPSALAHLTSSPTKPCGKGRLFPLKWDICQTSNSLLS